MRRNTSSSVDQRTYCCCQLNRCDLKRLPKRNCCQLYLSHIFLLMHDCSCFSRKIDTGFIQKTKLSEVLIITFHAKPESYFNKHRVAGILCSFYEILSSVTGSLGTMYPAILYQLISRTVETIVCRDNTCFQSSGHSNNVDPGS